MKGKVNRYKFHRIIGMIFLPFLIISVLTGFFRANYKWFWKEDYKKIKNTTYVYQVTPPKVPVDSIIDIVKSTFGNDITISEIKIKSEVGMLFYDVRFKNHTPVLLDADIGTVLSPVPEDLAKTMASQYVKEGLKIKNFYLDENYKTRKEHKPRPVYVAEYDDPLNTKIYLDKNNGDIEEEVDDNLKFGFWMVKLHDYDFWNAKRFNLSLVGIGLFFVSLTGFYIWLKRKPGRRKKSKLKPEISVDTLRRDFTD